MPNPNAPFGLRAVRRADGQPLGAVGVYEIASGLAENIGRGSLVKTTGTSVAGRPTINLATAGQTSRGVFVGCEYQAADGSYVFSPNWVSGTATKNSVPARAYVVDDPQTVFAVQVATIAVTDIGQACDIVVGAPDANGNATTSAAGSFSANAQLQVLGISPVPGRNEIGAYAVIEVKIVEHELSGVAGFVAT
jgi:hypothetical protein